MKLERRIINIRITFLAFCGLMVGILFGYFFLFSTFKVSTLWLMIAGVFTLLIGFFIYGCITEKHNLKYRFRKLVSLFIKLSCVLFAIFFVIGIIISSLPLLKMNSLRDYDDKVTISGKVSDYVQNNSTYLTFLLDDCVIIDGDREDKISYKICINSYINVDVKLGDDFVAVCELDRYVSTNKDDFNKLIQSIAYTTFVDNSNVVINHGSMILKDTIKQRTFEMLKNNINEDNAKIAYAILYGDSQDLGTDLNQMFSYAGITHILAVSGINVTILVALVYKLLNKIRINKYIRLVLLVFVLLAYSYLCSFTPSVLRASLMAIMLCICDITMSEYDMLSSLSLAGIINLLYKPMDLFTISFQLSYLCMFAIISVSPFISIMLQKIKCPKVLADAIAVSIATNICILPICVNCFETVSLIGIITNIFVLPLFDIMFVLLFVGVLIGFLIPGLSGVLCLSDLFLHIIKFIADLSTNISFGVFKVFNVGYILLMLIILTALILHFLMINKKIKSIAILLLTGIIVGVFVSNNVPNYYDQQNLLITSQTQSNIVVYVEDNEVTMIGSNVKGYQVARQLKKYKINHIDNILTYDLQLNQLDELESICDSYKVENVYILKNNNYSQILDRFNNTKVIDDNNFGIGKLNIHTIEYMHKYIGVSLSINDYQVLIPRLDISTDDGLYLSNEYSGVDYLLIKNFNSKINLNIIEPKNLILLNGLNKQDDNNIYLKNFNSINIKKMGEIEYEI